MPKSQAARAIYIRRWREKNYKDKRFNKPLREYIELKYGDIYNEYCSFFKSLDEQHPSSKDLTKTQTYREWKNELLNDESTESEDETDTTHNQIDPAEPDVLTAVEPAEPDTTDNQTERAEPDVLTVTIQETLSPVVNIDINIDINEVDSIIEQMINEFEQDDAIRDLLNQNNDELVHPHYQNGDEGIGLDIETELEDIIQPFDYYLEVEGFEF